jgi:hypothetical protein
VGKTLGSRPLGRPRHTWEDNIKMDLRMDVEGGIDWINLAQNRVKWHVVVNVVMNPQFP